MAVPWGLVTFLIGIAYGWLSPGKEDKSRLFMRGLLWGLGIAIVLALLGFFVGVDPLGLGGNGLIANIIAVVVLTLAFIVGVWLGDLLPGGKRTGPRTGMRRV